MQKHSFYNVKAYVSQHKNIPFTTLKHTYRYAEGCLQDCKTADSAARQDTCHRPNGCGAGRQCPPAQPRQQS